MRPLRPTKERLNDKDYLPTTCLITISKTVQYESPILRPKIFLVEKNPLEKTQAAFFFQGAQEHILYFFHTSNSNVGKKRLPSATIAIYHAEGKPYTLTNRNKFGSNWVFWLKLTCAPNLWQKNSFVNPPEDIRKPISLIQPTDAWYWPIRSARESDGPIETETRSLASNQ